MYLVPTQANRGKMIDEMTAKYSFLKKSSIGKSLCERDLTCLMLGNGKNAVLWVAAFHGIEWLTSLVVLKFLSSICESLKYNKKIYGVDIVGCLAKRGLVILPCMNPDGVEISLTGSQAAGDFKNIVDKASGGDTSLWKANARGVDLNHNYSAGWNDLKALELKSGISKPAPTRYGGEAPESEPETQALVKFCRKNKFGHALAFHSQGEEIYWNFGDKTPEGSQYLANLFAFSSGYELNQPEGLAVGGGFKDWFITEFNKPGFTIEIGKGKNPLPISDLDSIYKKIEKMLLISAFL